MRTKKTCILNIDNYMYYKNVLEHNTSFKYFNSLRYTDVKINMAENNNQHSKHEMH